MFSQVIGSNGSLIFDEEINATMPISSGSRRSEGIKLVNSEYPAFVTVNHNTDREDIRDNPDSVVPPSELNIVLDVRVNDRYTNKEIYEILKKDAPCKIKPRSLNLNSSSIDLEHPIVKGADSIQIEKYGSPTLSDQSKISFPSIKIGPGDSKRSHTADEFIYINEIKNAIPIYIKLLNTII